MDVLELASSLHRASFEADRTALIMRKQRNVEQAQAEALIQLVQTPSREGVGQLIDVRV